MDPSERAPAEPSSHYLHDSFSCFDDDEDADILSATDALSQADEKEVTKKSSRSFVRPLVVTVILGVGAVLSITAYTVTKKEDQRLCEESATEAANDMQSYAEEGLRTSIDTSGFQTDLYNCTSSWPAIFSVLIAVCFLLSAGAFFWCDRRQQRKYDEAQELAERTTSLVASLYPKQVRDRLFNQEQAPKTSLKSQSKDKRSSSHGYRDDDGSPTLGQNGVMGKEQAGEALDNGSWHSRKQPVKRTSMERTERALNDSDDAGEIFTSMPIADLFPETSILFADLAGFTAWSSARQPTEVFMLLETLYGNFDIIAKKYGIFKVETIGDCYVAASGLPDSNAGHALAMCRFARDCLAKTKELVKKLEIKLGPDTADLNMRIGIHSGPVTGGVLRGEKSRFQLFGDSMNTAARIETTGMKGRIHLSQATADSLSAKGKTNWFYAREEKVFAKGKGELQTYWLKVGKRNPEKSNVKSKARIPSGPKLQKLTEAPDDQSDSTWSDSDYDSDDSGGDYDSQELLSGLVSEKTARLIDWNVDNLQRLLKEVVAAKALRGVTQDKNSVLPFSGFSIPLDELGESLEFDPLPQKLTPAEVAVVQLDRDAVTQLHDFVTNIAIMYKDNDYNNFERSSQMLLAITKFIARVDDDSFSGAGKRFAADPLAVFSAAFCALVHDVDHPGVLNETFAKENDKMNSLFRGTSMAEQNSFDLAFGLFMDDTYSALRAALFSSQNDVIRFRRMTVNLLLATDIMDEGLKARCDIKWAQALLKSGKSDSEKDFKATVIGELMMQAADNVHTMQHIEVYKKWNERSYAEQHAAFRQGRIATDPASFWYESELNFFDDTVIPLAEKLSTCGVFGSLGGECLSYAVTNRQVWQDTGHQIIEQMAAAQRRVLDKTSSHQPLANKALAHKTTRPPMPSVDKKLTDMAKKTTNSNLGAAMNSLMSKVNALQQVEERMASGSEHSARVSASPQPETNKNLSSIAKRATGSEIGSAMSLLMNQVNAMQQIEEQIASASAHGRSNFTPSGDDITSDGESSSNDENSSIESSESE